MKRILVFDGDEAHANELAGALRSHRYQVMVLQSRDEIVSGSGWHGMEIDLIVLSFDPCQSADWQALDGLVEVGLVGRMRGILCVSRVYRGPIARLDVEKRGGRLVYER